MSAPSAAPPDAPAAAACGQLFDDAQPPSTGERFDTLLARPGLRIERIVSSTGITSGECLQAEDEWVLLVRGQARLRVRDQVLTLTAGDHVFLPAGTPHQVLDTSDGAMWLAVHRLHP